MVRFELVIAIIFGLHRDFDFNHVIYGFIKIIAIISGPALYKCIKINPLNNLYSHGFHSIYEGPISWELTSNFQASFAQSIYNWWIIEWLSSSILSRIKISKNKSWFGSIWRKNCFGSRPTWYRMWRKGSTDRPLSGLGRKAEMFSQTVRIGPDQIWLQ